MTEDTTRIDTSLGELMAALYDTFMELYDDAELASVATAAMVNEMLAEQAHPTSDVQAA